MCVTTEVSGKFKLKGAKANPNAAFDEFLQQDGYDQHLPGQKRDVTYVTRLQAVKAAVETQIEENSQHHPNRRVGLVTFSSGVNVLGDGSKDPHTVNPDMLSDFDGLIDEGEALSASMFAKSVTETKVSLLDRLNALDEAGPTCLGPALVTSVAAASQQQGSNVILCTDGFLSISLFLSVKNIVTHLSPQALPT